MENKTEYCPDCGREIVYFQPTPYSSLIQKTCACYWERKQAELEQANVRAREYMRNNCGLPKKFLNARFENYIPMSESQKECAHLALDFACGRHNETGEWFFMVGDVGLGKTHLSAAIINAVIDSCAVGEQDAKKFITGTTYITPPCRYMRCTDLIENTKERMNNKNLIDYEGLCKGTQLLILDDFGVTNATDWNKDLFYRILDYRYIYEKPTVLSTNLTVEEIKDALGTRTYDRIKEMCKRPIVITGESFRGKGKSPDLTHERN